MNDQERKLVLRMIEAGRLTPEEGLRLIQALEQSPADDDGPRTQLAVAPFRPRESEGGTKVNPDPAVQRGVEAARAVWLAVPLAIGVLVVVLGGWITLLHLQPSPFSIWFYGLGLPLILLGVVLIMAASASQRARWVYLRVEQAPGERPRTLVLGFPAPLGLACWTLRTIGRFVPELDQAPLKEIFRALRQTTSSDSPLVVSVDERDHGKRVQAYFG